MHNYNQRDQTDRGWGWLAVRNAVLVASVAIMAMLAAVTLGGCTATRYVPLESVRTEYVHGNTDALEIIIAMLREQLVRKECQVDSLMRTRNERLVLNDKGDTLRHDTEVVEYRSTYREKELERLVESQRDSIRELHQQLQSVKVDSIPVPYPVEKQLTRWEQAKMDVGGFAMGGCAVAVIFVVVWIVRRFRNR